MSNIVLGSRGSTPQNWQPVKKFAIALHTFESEGPNELALSVGDELRVEEECVGWYKGTILASYYRTDASKTVGVFPATFVKTGASIDALKMDREVILMESQEYLARQDVLVDEIMEEGDVDGLMKSKEHLVKLLALRKKLVGKENEFWKKEMRQILGISIPLLERPRKSTYQLSTSPQLLQAIGASIEKGSISGGSSLSPVARVDKSPTTDRKPTVSLNRTASATQNIQPTPEGSPIPRKSTRAAELKTRTGNDSIISLYRTQTEMQKNRLLSTGTGLTKSPSAAKSPPMSPSGANSGLRRKPPHLAHKTTSSERVGGPPSPSSSQLNLTRGMTSLNLRGSSDVSIPVKVKEVKFYHLLVDVKAFMCATGEPNEISCSIYRADTKKFISEEFVVKMTANGMPEDVTKIGEVKALFTDISESELTGTAELYLVVRITRIGKLATPTFGTQISSSKSSKKEFEFRRPFGGAVKLLQLSELIPTDPSSESEDEGSLIIPSNNPEISSTLSIFTVEDENEMYNLHESIVKKHNLTTLPHAKGIVLGLQLNCGPYDELCQQYGDKFREIPQVSRLLFPDSGITAVRNDFYLTLESGKLGKSENIQVNVVIRGEDGEVINNSISSGVGSNLKKEHFSLVLLKEAAPVWRDTINVQIENAQKFLSAHAYFTVKACHESSSKEKELYFGWLPLATSQGCAIADLEHNVTLFSLPKEEKGIQTTEGGITLVPVSLYLKDESFKTGKSLRKEEFLKVRTLLTSTQLTNNVSMFQLLKWKELSKETLPDLLNMFTYISTPEVLKFFKESFDALFAIMETGNADLQSLVYNALVFMVGLFVDDKTVSVSGAQLKPVLDKYVDEQFVGKEAHLPILRYLKEALVRTTASKINPTLKSLEYLLRFAIKSRIKQKLAKDSEEDDIIFKKELSEVFFLINKLMEKTDATFRGAQTYTFKNFGQLGGEMGKIYSGTEYALIVKAFLESMQYDASLKLLNAEKLSFVKRIVKNSHLLNEESQVIIFLICIKAILPHLKSNTEEEKSESISIILDIHQKLETTFRAPEKIPEVMIEMGKVVPMIMKHIISLKDGPQRMDAITCLLVTFSKMRPDDFEAMFECDPNPVGVVLRILKIFHSLIILPTYPESWVNLVLFQYTSIAQTTTQLFEIITQTNLMTKNNGLPNFDGSEPDGRALEIKSSFDLVKSQDLKSSFELTRSGSLTTSGGSYHSERKETVSMAKSSALDVYRHFFKLCTLFLQSKALAEIANSTIESSKVDALNKGFLQLIQNVWKTLERSTKVEFIHTIIPILLDFQIIPSEEFRRTASNLYFDAMDAEYNHTESLSGTGQLTIIESRTFDCIRKIAEDSSKQFNEEWVDNFFSAIQTKTNELSEEQSQQKSRFEKFVVDTKDFTGHLQEIRTLPSSSAYDEDRTAANLKLVEYLKSTNRPEGYVTFLLNLVDNQEKSKSFTEAGEVLLLIASLYTWSDEEKLPAISGSKFFTEETHGQRKEKLYMRAIEAFTKGNMWEKSLSLLKEACIYFENNFDYSKLSNALEMQSSLFKRIVGEHRFFNEYFIVGFYGKGFDKNLRGKVFIYRGNEAERREDFVERFMVLFPDAQVLSYSNDPPPEIMESEQKHLQITPVKPSSVEELEGKPSKIPANMPSNFQKYYKSNDVNVFLFSKPFRKTKTKSDNEFKDLWLKNTFYVTQDTFPSVQRRSLVINRVEVEVSPIETAVKAMKEKNTELKDQLLKNDNSNSSPSALQDFVMVFKGVIDAAVNGGTDRYKDAFFTEAYISENPQDQHYVDSLREELDYQNEFLDKGMEVMKRKVVKGSDMSNLLTILEEQLNNMTQKSSRSSSTASSLSESSSSNYVGLPS
eukprot:TRINITY_DN1423_c0_g1_i1.p1 TRINITY_DN1423_c0_g1~~TRINITY_DN1423_c0_g1_i1.p1  ORF type:complete len:1858 (+),score=684.59 TRINITY_DN1423_c0_g1_i1:134-5707(+)